MNHVTQEEQTTSNNRIRIQKNQSLARRATLGQRRRALVCEVTDWLSVIHRMFWKGRQGGAYVRA